MVKAPSSGRVLNATDAALVKGMINRGDRQHDIAAYFAVNGGRIGETSTGAKFASVTPAKGGLPPAAPYLVLDASLRNEAISLRSDLKALGVSKSVTDNLDRIIGGMDASKQARRGK